MAKPEIGFDSEGLPSMICKSVTAPFVKVRFLEKPTAFESIVHLQEMNPAFITTNSIKCEISSVVTRQREMQVRVIAHDSTEGHMLFHSDQ